MLVRRSDIALAALLAIAAVACRPRGDAPLPAVDDALPRLALPTAEGPSFDPERLRGKVVVVNFWSPG